MAAARRWWRRSPVANLMRTIGTRLDDKPVSDDSLAPWRTSYAGTPRTQTKTSTDSSGSSSPTRRSVAATSCPKNPSASCTLRRRNRPARAAYDVIPAHHYSGHHGGTSPTQVAYDRDPLATCPTSLSPTEVSPSRSFDRSRTKSGFTGRCDRRVRWSPERDLIRGEVLSSSTRPSDDRTGRRLFRSALPRTGARPRPFSILGPCRRPRRTLEVRPTSCRIRCRLRR